MGVYLCCHGKNRKNRSSRLTKQTAAVVRVCLEECPGNPTTHCSGPGRRRGLSSDALECPTCQANRPRPRPLLVLVVARQHLTRHVMLSQVLSRLEALVSESQRGDRVDAGVKQLPRSRVPKHALCRRPPQARLC